MSSPRFLGITQSVCPVCRSLVPAKLIGIEGDLYFEKFCPVHGQERVFVRADIDDYIQTSSNELQTANDFTISLWFKADATNFGHHLLWQGYNTAQGWGQPSDPLQQEMHISMGDIIRGVIPFVALVLVALIILAIFPDIALWLPSQMIK